MFKYYKITNKTVFIITINLERERKSYIEEKVDGDRKQGDKMKIEKEKGREWKIWIREEKVERESKKVQEGLKYIKILQQSRQR